MSELEHLFQPIKMRGVTIPNRILSSAHMTNFADPITHLPTARHADYYEARAKGGIGLIVMEAQSITRHNCPIPPVCIADNDDVIPLYKAITGAVHRYDTRIFCQLWHSGHANMSKTTFAPSQSCSNVPPLAYYEVPAELEVEEIKEVIDQYVATTRRAKTAGFDGVEIHAGHGYLPQQFMSPAHNLRSDEYGGSLENRMRFVLEVIDAVRKEIGEEKVVGMRISGDEFTEGGLSLEDMMEIAQILEDTGQIDFLHVSCGSYSAGMGGILALPPMGPVPLRPIVYLASEIKQVVNIPVFTVSRINDPVMANDIVKNNEADMVAMTRATICDPDLPNKAKEDRLDEIRMCMACNEACWGRCEKMFPITCAQNPEAGREGELKITEARQKKKVMIVGGGPAGLSAARVAALRGHDVTLYEKNEEFGGQVLLAGSVESRAEIKECIRNYEKEIRRLPVEIRLGVEVTAEMVLAEDPDEVILATGAIPIENLSADVVGPPSAVEVDPEADVVSAWRVLEGAAGTGQKVLIYDNQLHIQGFLVAEKLLDEGKKVKILQAARRAIGPAIDSESGTTGVTMAGAVNKGLEIILPMYKLTRIAPGKAIGINIITQAPIEFPCDTVVLSYWRLPNAKLFKELKGKVKSLRRAGDCLAPRFLTEAFYSGYMAGYEV